MAVDTIVEAPETTPSTHRQDQEAEAIKLSEAAEADHEVVTTTEDTEEIMIDETYRHRTIDGVT